MASAAGADVARAPDGCMSVGFGTRRELRCIETRRGGPAGMVGVEVGLASIERGRW